tara:strand:+ start:244 stop:681 length:438 start_codon:yes stop_codon:yes gene_type:complete
MKNVEKYLKMLNDSIVDENTIVDEKIDMKILEDLTQSGFGIDCDEINQNTVIRIMNFLKNKGVMDLPMIKGYAKEDSYSIKHYVEDAMGQYLPMGDVIQALHELGFKIRRCRNNCDFNLSAKQIKCIKKGSAKYDDDLKRAVRNW